MAMSDNAKRLRYHPFPDGDTWLLMPVDDAGEIQSDGWLGPFATRRDAERANVDTGYTNGLLLVCIAIVALLLIAAWA